MKLSLFTRLVSYSQNPVKQSIENFTTEVLAHLIDSDPFFRRIFISYIIRDDHLAADFKLATTTTQLGFGNGFVDLVLMAGDHKVLVEVKIGAPETITNVKGLGWTPQVKKYLSYRQGHVAYLTTQASRTPDVNDPLFLGHFFFEDLYQRLERQQLTTTGQLFMDFMEENDMKPLEPFTPQELAIAPGAFDFAKKCEATIDKLISTIGPKFDQIFGTQSGFTRPNFSPKQKSVFAYTKGFSYPPIECVTIYIGPINSALDFGAWVKVSRADISNLKQRLGWQEKSGSLYSTHPLTANLDHDMIAKEILSDLEHLKRALDQGR